MDYAPRLNITRKEIGQELDFKIVTEEILRNCL